MKTGCTWINMLLVLLLAVSLGFNVFGNGLNLFGRKAPQSSGVIAPVGTTGPLSVPQERSYIDSSGAHHVVIDEQANEQMNRQAARAAAPIAAKLDSLASALDLKPKQIEGYAAVVVAASADSVRILRRTVDSLKRQTFYYKDRYLALTFRAGSPTDSLTASNFDFAYDVDLRTVDYMKRQKILGLSVGRKQYFTDISSSDPRVRIKGVEKFSIPRRMPPFGFRLQAQASYNMLLQTPSAGLGVRFDAGDRFNVGVNYSYNFGAGAWAPIIYSQYDLVQFGR